MTRLHKIRILATQQVNGLTWAYEPPHDDPLAPLRALPRNGRFHEAGWPEQERQWKGVRLIALFGYWRVSGDIDAVIAALNASRLDRLVIALDTFYVPNHRSYVLRRFFDTLDSQGLRYLCVLDTLEACTVPSVAAFLRSTRSSSLQALIVNGYTLDLAHAEVVAAALEGNTSLRSLCFGKCWSNGRWCVCLKSDGYGPAHNRMEYAPVAEVLKRNRAAGAELRRAIEAVLTPARVLFRAHENIPRIQVTSASDDEGDSATPTTPRPFPILRLPSHILTLVLEHCGDDGLTKPQFRALLHVAGSDTAPKVRHRAVSLELARGRKLSDVRDELYARVLGSS